MTEALAREVWDALRERLDCGLRGVARYDGAEFDAVLRDDVREQYSSVQRQQIVDAFVVGQLNAEGLTDVLEVGPMDANVQVFGSAYVISCPESLDGKAGFLVSLDRDGTESSALSVERTIRYLNERTPVERERP